MKRAILATLLAFPFGLAAPSASTGSPMAVPVGGSSAPEHAKALAAAAHDLCGHQIVLLGENGFHGDGETTAFKAKLVEMLVRRCGFKAVFFEASSYDFAAFERAVRHGRPTSERMVASSIGAKWSRDTEMAGLIAFLYEQARARRVTLGGLDDQLGSLNAFYSLEEMPAELGRDVGGAPGEQCAAQLRQRIWSRYAKEDPYTPTVREKLLACLAGARRAVDASAGDAEDRSDLLFMIGNFERYLARDNLKMAELVPARDFSMYQNLRALEARLPAGTKAIIWAANAHVAKDPARNPSWPKGRNLGSYVNEAFGARAFVLGFTAASGSFRWDRTTSRPIDPAQPASLEAEALAGTRAASVYLGPTKLGKLGTVVGSAFDDHKPVSARWSEVYDGIVVFRAERPTEQAAS